jgi:hypothetical protein
MAVGRKQEGLDSWEPSAGVTRTVCLRLTCRPTNQPSSTRINARVVACQDTVCVMWQQ